MALNKRDSPDREAAESLAIQALAYLAGEPERLGRFLALSGLGPEQVRRAAAEPGFLAGVLEYLSSEESLLLGFAEHVRVAPEHSLPGPVGAMIAARAQGDRRTCPASAAIASRMRLTTCGDAGRAARRACCATASSRRLRSPMSIATPFTPPSKNVTSLVCTTNR